MFLEQMDEIKSCVAASFRRNAAPGHSPENTDPAFVEPIEAIKKECFGVLAKYSADNNSKPTSQQKHAEDVNCSPLLYGGHPGDDRTYVYALCDVEPSAQPHAQDPLGASLTACKGSVLFRQAVPQSAQASAAAPAPQTVARDSAADGFARVWYDLQGLRPNAKHGMHIHETGCDHHECGATGGHWNPHGAAHGDFRDAPRCHAGDLGNVQADGQGRAKGTLDAGLVHLFGPYTVIGRAVVIHADEDDLGRGDSSEPGTNGKTSLTTGNSGARLACGRIRPTTRTVHGHLFPDA
jgi:Cu-Zn family superoxide dismutase